MRVRVKRFMLSCERNVKGKKLNERYAYVIEIKRWFKKKRYLRLLPGWVNALLKEDEKVKIELTRMRGQATTFYEGEQVNHNDWSTAMLIVSLIKKKPNKFVFN